MPWYDVVFLMFVGALIGAGITYVARPQLSDRERAYQTDRRGQYRRGMALAFSPGERVWVIGFMLFMFALLLWTLS